VISRHWKGTTKPGLAQSYVRHLLDETFPRLRELPGFVSAQILKRDVSSVTEFQIVTLWESLRAIQAFAGEDHELAVVPEVAQALLLSFDRRVEHYEVVERVGSA
jgi:heme-degrading monooxygenase HmoA